MHTKNYYRQFRDKISYHEMSIPCERPAQRILGKGHVGTTHYGQTDMTDNITLQFWYNFAPVYHTGRQMLPSQNERFA